jgi:hypothetical protein
MKAIGNGGKIAFFRFSNLIQNIEQNFVENRLWFRASRVKHRVFHPSRLEHLSGTGLAKMRGLFAAFSPRSSQERIGQKDLIGAMVS